MQYGWWFKFRLFINLQTAFSPGNQPSLYSPQPVASSLSTNNYSMGECLFPASNHGGIETAAISTLQQQFLTFIFTQTSTRPTQSHSRFMLLRFNARILHTRDSEYEVIDCRPSSNIIY